jgi:hypothetical protein
MNSDDRRPPPGIYFTLDERGNPVEATGLLQWSDWYGASLRNGSRFIAETTIGNVRVSTIFLGMAHTAVELCEFDLSYLWESMVFGGPFDRLMQRYKTKAEALKGHEGIISRLTGDGQRMQPEERGVLQMFIDAAKEAAKDKSE